MSAPERRDALLSTYAHALWPYDALLSATPLPLSAAVLDVGAGSGGLLGALRARGHQGQLVGVDLQAAAGIVAADAAALPFAAGRFDVAVFLRCLPHMPDPARALQEACRVCRPGGQVIAAWHGPSHLAAFWQRAQRPAAPDPLAGWLKTLGFTQLDVLLPVTLDADAVTQLALSYGARPKVKAPLADHLHLQVFVTQ